MFQLHCLEGPLVGKRLPIPQEEIVTLGRHHENHLVFDSPKVSRKHAEFIQKGSSLFLKDLGSQNGVYLNGKRIENSSMEVAIELQAGDEISFGDYIFTLEQTMKEREEVSDPVFSQKRQTNPSSGLAQIPVRDSDIENKAHVAMLYGAYRALAQASNEKEFYEGISLLIIKILKAERVCIMSMDAKKKTLLPKYFASLSFLGKKAHFEPSMMVLHQVMNNRTTIYTIDAGSDERFKDGQSITDVGVRSIICAPFFGEKNLLGAIYVDTLQSENSFGPEEKVHLEALANLIVAAKDHF